MLYRKSALVLAQSKRLENKWEFLFIINTFFPVENMLEKTSISEPNGSHFSEKKKSLDMYVWCENSLWRAFCLYNDGYHLFCAC